MLSDEEREALEILELYFGENSALNITKYVNIVLNLIKKQQKEIEELKENNGYHLGFIDGGIAKRYEYEDKIKAKIEEIENTGIDVAWEQVNYTIREQDRAKIEVLQSLLEKE